MEQKNERTTREKIARVVSLITITPFQIIAYITFARTITTSLIPIIILDLLNSLFFLIIPSLSLVYVYLEFVKKRKVRVKGAGVLREHRWIMFILAFITYFVAFGSYFIIQQSFQLNMIPFFQFINVLLLINIFDCVLTFGPTKFKTSMHMSGGTGSIMIIYLTLGHLWFLLYCFLPLIFWARWESKGHTIPQLISGTVIGIFVPLIYFFIYDVLLTTVVISSLILIEFVVFIIRDKFPDIEYEDGDKK
ncbi:MAG: hypothetical protein EAX96_13465 [Candidatus Lokiarchaeota archaeon]|nr:hypothetical protein [Candidatus Lokiarchaeota archaeon]